MRSIGRVSKTFQRDEARKARQAAMDEMDSIFANHEHRVKKFLKTAGAQTIKTKTTRQADLLNIQESDDLVFRVSHSIGRKKRNLTQMDGDEEYE